MAIRIWGHKFGCGKAPGNQGFRCFGGDHSTPAFITQTFTVSKGVLGLVVTIHPDLPGDHHQAFGNIFTNLAHLMPATADFFMFFQVLEDISAGKIVSQGFAPDLLVLMGFDVKVVALLDLRSTLLGANRRRG